jgi:hypothetical protein
MADRRFGGTELNSLVGTEVVPARAVDGGTDPGSSPVAPNSDVGIPVRQLLGMKVHTVSVSGGTATVDCGFGLHRHHTLELGGNVALALSNAAPAGYVTEGEVRIVQDAAGSHELALPAGWVPLRGSRTGVVATAGAMTILSFKAFGTSVVEYILQGRA